MSDSDTNQHLLALLAVHRQRLRHLRQQAAVFDPGYVPSHVALALAEACRDVATVKGQLRRSGATVDDQPEDDLPQSQIGPASGGGTDRASRFTIQGSIQAGVVNLGGLTHVAGPVEVSFGGASIDSQEDRTSGTPRSEAAGRATISQLAAHVEDVLAAAPAEHTAAVANVRRRMQALVDAASASALDRDFIAFQAESLRRAAVPLEPILQDIGARIAALVRACSEAQQT
jgi:hypothetical protein